MTLSARRLGIILGLSSQEVNVLLKMEGFQDGLPGEYYPTEKGKSYMVVKMDDNGQGGFAARDWEWAEWDESIINEIGEITLERRKDIRAYARELRAEKKRIEEINRRNYEQNEQKSERHFESDADTEGSKKKSNRRSIIKAFLEHILGR